MYIKSKQKRLYQKKFFYFSFLFCNSIVGGKKSIKMTTAQHISKPGLYQPHDGRIGVRAYQTKQFARFVELYNPTNEPYCCKGSGMRHPAAGFQVKKTNV